MLLCIVLSQRSSCLSPIINDVETIEREKTNTHIVGLVYEIDQVAKSCLDGNEKAFSGAKSNTIEPNVSTGLHAHGDSIGEAAVSQDQIAKATVEVCHPTQVVNDPIKEVPLKYATKLSPTVNLGKG